MLKERFKDVYEIQKFIEHILEKRLLYPNSNGMLTNEFEKLGYAIIMNQDVDIIFINTSIRVLIFNNDKYEIVTVEPLFD